MPATPPESPSAPAVPLDASTVVLLRDTSHGMEVFLARRHIKSSAFAGVYVFPGGKLDAQDCNATALSLLQCDPQDLHARLGEPELLPDVAAGLHVAALRELLEEAGVQLPIGALQPWTRWITPEMPLIGNKRFDTRFFIARMPEGEVATHDEHETTNSAWLTPRDALTQYWAGQIELAPPQIMSLVELARYPDVQEAIQAAAARRPPVILPAINKVEGIRVMSYPGDALHPVPKRAMPGPSRLYVREAGRFEPESGFEGFFSD